MADYYTISEEPFKVFLSKYWSEVELCLYYHGCQQFYCVLLMWFAL